MRRLLAALALASALAACGGANPRSVATRPRPVSSSQALELARVLLGDYTHSGSRVVGTYTLEHQPLDFVGAIDFHNGTGTLSLHQRSLPLQSPRRFYWTRGVVLAQAAPGSLDYLANPLDPQGGPVDHLIAFFGLLSAPAIDNVQLLETSGVSYLGSAHGIDRFRYGRMVLSVDHATGLLSAVRLTQTDGSTIAVALLSHAPLRIALPERSRWKAVGH